MSNADGLERRDSSYQMSDFHEFGIQKGGENT